jgi:6-phospho-beta-glucosidase
LTGKLTILGGSSLFVLDLFDTISRSEKPLPFHDICLHGRAADRLQAIQSYGSSRLEMRRISVSATVKMEEALADASHILLQIRFGGLEARCRNEEFCAQAAVPTDESLGLMGLLTACQIRKDILELAMMIDRIAPAALVVNMINPLSISTAMLSSAGLNVVGICELPTVTLTKIARECSCSVDDVSFDYTGFNHRGFFFDLKRGKVDLIDLIVNKADDDIFSKSDKQDIDELHAVPLKYFKMIKSPTIEAGRAKYLIDLASKIQSELAADPGRAPPSLAARQSDWYDLAVVPFFEGLMSVDQKPAFLNLPDGSGLVREYPVAISQNGIRIAKLDGSPSSRVSSWMEAFSEVERNLAECMRNLDQRNVFRTMECDPMIPDGVADRIIDPFMKQIKRDELEGVR